MASRTRLGLGLALMLGTSSSCSTAVVVDWVEVGDPGNACDAQADGCFGAVAGEYRIGRHEVTNAQYAAFLNAKAASDPLGLYNPGMTRDPRGGITRSGDDGGYRYGVVAGRENHPVNYVSFYDALRFVNWLANGQGDGDTESGAYTLLGATATPINGTTLTRDPDARIFLPSEDEWYKSAYYDPVGLYHDYPTASDAPTLCAAPGPTAGTANCDQRVGDTTPVGSYPGSASPYGTFDQGGNVWEWNETIVKKNRRGRRGGNWLIFSIGLAASARINDSPSKETGGIGFRLASSPAGPPAPSRAGALRTSGRGGPGPRGTHPGPASRWLVAEAHR